MQRLCTVTTLLGVVTATLACAGLPRVVRHPRPEFKADAAPFLHAGCVTKQPGWLECPASSAPGAVGCDSVAVSDAYGGLDPEVPFAACLLYSEQRPPATEYIRPPGGLIPLYLRYVVLEDGRFVVLKSAEAVRQRFAPITSASEAISLAVALTDLSLFYGFVPTKKLRYEVSKLEDTYAEATASGFVVHNLRHDRFFDCGPHPTSLVTLSVSADGHVTELSRRRVFRDPAIDALCID